MNFIIIGHKGRLGSQIYEKAKQTHNVIGIEKDEKYFNIAKDRIEKEKTKGD